MKENLIVTGFVLFVIWVGIAFGTLAVGVSDARFGPNNGERCGSAFTRIEYAFPAYRLGCWLGSPR